jgi:multidrug efflux system membrane fusion protein
MEGGGSKLMSEDRPQPLQLAPPKPAVAPPSVNGAGVGGKTPPSPVSSRRRWIWVVVLIVLAAGSYFVWRDVTATNTASTPAKGGGKNGTGGAPTPVVAAKTKRGNIGVYYNGLGTVTPLNTVTVKSRVDGQLLKVQYKEGDLVHQGDVLVQIDPGPYQVALEQAQGQLAKDQATLQNARVDMNRYQTLFKEGVISEQQSTTQNAQVATDEGIIKADQGQVDAAKLNITYTNITAPITGKIGLRLVDAGNMVHASDANGLVVITQIQPISVIFTIAEDQLQVVAKKMAAGQKLSADAYDREMTTKLASGTLTTLDNQIDPQTGTLKLRATYDNQDSALFPNQFVNVRLLVEQKSGVTLAPTAAIQRNTNNTYVYLVQQDSTVTVRNVTVGTSEGDNSEITEGLVPGDVVVLTGVDKLQEGSKVNAQIPGDSGAQNAKSGSSPTASPNPARKSGAGTKKGK